MNGIMTETVRVSGNFGAGSGGFNDLLLSEPVELPFPGDYAQVRVVYNLGRIKSWHAHNKEIIGRYEQAERSIRRELISATEAFNAEWEQKREEPGFSEDAYYAASDRWDDVIVPQFGARLVETSHEIVYAMVDYLVHHVECWPVGADKPSAWLWPLTPQPNPHDRDTMGVWDFAVWEWMVEPSTLAAVSNGVMVPKKTMKTASR